MTAPGPSALARAIGEMIAPMPKQFTRDEAAFWRGQQEAWAVRIDQHPHVVAVRNAFENLIIGIGMGWDLDGVAAEAETQLKLMTLRPQPQEER